MGGRSKLMKRTKRTASRKNNVTKNQKYLAKIETMPEELVTEVLARVAASSFTDFFNAKLSSKVFNSVSDEDYIYKHVSLGRFPMNSWNRVSEEASAFLKRCKECGNPESLYRQALRDYLHDKKLECGVENLKKAAEKGHMGALYALGIILLFSSNDESKTLGINTISELKKSSLTTQVKEIRKNFGDFISRIWKGNDFLFRDVPTCCTQRHPRNNYNGWEVNSRYLCLDQDCEACQCDLELALITCSNDIFTA